MCQDQDETVDCLTKRSLRPLHGRSPRTVPPFADKELFLLQPARRRWLQLLIAPRGQFLLDGFQVAATDERIDARCLSRLSRLFEGADSIFAAHMDFETSSRIDKRQPYFRGCPSQCRTSPSVHAVHSASDDGDFDLRWIAAVTCAGSCNWCPPSFRVDGDVARHWGRSRQTNKVTRALR